MGPNTVTKLIPNINSPTTHFLPQTRTTISSTASSHFQNFILSSTLSFFLSFIHTRTFIRETFDLNPCTRHRIYAIFDSERRKIWLVLHITRWDDWVWEIKEMNRENRQREKERKRERELREKRERIEIGGNQGKPHIFVTTTTTTTTTTTHEKKKRTNPTPLSLSHTHKRKKQIKKIKLNTRKRQNECKKKKKKNATKKKKRK